VVPRCRAVTYWLIRGSGLAPRQIRNNAAICARGLYNVEARPKCSRASTVALPVVIKLSNRNRRNVRTRADATAPYLLWGRQPAAARTLPNGVYYLTSSINGGAVRFTQSCPHRRPLRA
jgi:hypothetical protein